LTGVGKDTILEYIFNRYGRDRVAFVAPMWIQIPIFREVGKGFGLPKEELDALAKTSSITRY
jgi:DNA polymerase III alpha subunit